jgi:hypothetical protein
MPVAPRPETPAIPGPPQSKARWLNRTVYQAMGGSG